jgi:hypothetical protein
VPHASLPDLLGGFHRAIAVMLAMAVLTVLAAVASLIAGERASRRRGAGGPAAAVPDPLDTSPRR